MSTCGKCGGHLFTLQEIVPAGSNFKLLSTQCSSCGVPVGITEYHNSGAMIDKLQRKINSLSGDIANIDHNIGIIMSELRRR